MSSGQVREKEAEGRSRNYLGDCRDDLHTTRVAAVAGACERNAIVHAATSVPRLRIVNRSFHRATLCMFVHGLWGRLMRACIGHGTASRVW